MNRSFIYMLLSVLLTSCSHTVVANSIVIGSLREGILFESVKTYAVNTAGAELASSLPFSDAYKAEWSPDRQWIAYQTQDTAKRTDPQIFVVKSDGTKKFTLTNNVYPCGFEPRWSPDGKRIVAFFCAQNGKDGIYTVDVSCIDSKEDCIFGYKYVADPGSTPIWSSDGKQIAFTNPNHQLIVVSLEPLGNTRIISPKDMECYDSAWSPTSNDIAVSCYVPNKGANIFLVNPDGRNFRNISNSESRDLLPTWSPDGTRIAFVSDRFGSRQIIYPGISSDAVYVMNNDGTSVKRISLYNNEIINWIDWVSQ